MFVHMLSGREAKKHQSVQRTLHPVCDRDSLSVEGSGQLLNRQAADDDTRYKVLYVCVFCNLRLLLCHWV